MGEMEKKRVKKGDVDVAGLFSGMIPIKDREKEKEKEIVKIEESFDKEKSNTEKNIMKSIKEKEKKVEDLIEVIDDVTKKREESGTRPGRKADLIKNTQVSIFLTPEMHKELRIQDALREKEANRSAIARVGIDMVLSLSTDNYIFLKQIAQENNITEGEMNQRIVEEYRKKFN